MQTAASFDYAKDFTRATLLIVPNTKTKTSPLWVCGFGFASSLPLAYTNTIVQKLNRCMKNGRCSLRWALLLAMHLPSELSNSLAVWLLKHLSFDFPTLPLDAFGVILFFFFFLYRCFSNVTSAPTRDCKVAVASFTKQHILLMLMLYQAMP